MDPRLLEHYNTELAHLREMGAEFSREFPKIAARLGIEGLEVADPYVERLLEGFAFVAARTQLKLDAEFPRFTQHLLQMVYPTFLSPMPSMALCSFVPNFADGALTMGVEIARGTALMSSIARGEQTACEFRTAHAVKLWPVEIAQVRYVSFAPDLPLDRLALSGQVKGALRIVLRCHGGLKFSQLAMNALEFYIAAPDNLAMPLLELVHSHCVGGVLASGAVAAAADNAQRPFTRVDSRQIYEIGFNDDDALLPSSRQSFQGYRLLQEYFSFPQRFMFFGVQKLSSALAKVDAQECELTLFFDRAEPALESTIDNDSLALYATPIINLFSKRADRIHLSEQRHEHHLVIDRARPMDFEVFAVADVRGYGVDSDADINFRPFYHGFDEDPEDARSRRRHRRCHCRQNPDDRGRGQGDRKSVV